MHKGEMHCHLEDSGTPASLPTPCPQRTTPSPFLFLDLSPGFLVLCAYGLIPTLQPSEASFSRVYAVYGGFFILLSYCWGWAVDGDRPDAADWVGAAVAVAGVLLAWFWPRG